MPTMSETELRAVCAAEIRNCIGLPGGLLSNWRRDAMKAYLGEPYGDEVDGRSKVVLRDVLETVEWVMPSLMRIFFAGNELVRYQPNRPDGEDGAAQATDYVNYVLRAKNQIFLALHDWFKDALILRVGIIKAWWEETVRTKTESYDGLTDIQLQALLADGDTTLITDQATPIEGMPPAADGSVPQLHDVTIQRRIRSAFPRVRAVPPDEFLIARRAVSIEGSPFVAHRVRRSVTELLEMGYDRDVVENLPLDSEQEYNMERIQRYAQEDEWPFASPGGEIDPSLRELWITEAYIRVDYNGDGKAELRKVTWAGDGDALVFLDNEEYDLSRPPFYDVCPVRIPHKVHGLSMTDLVADLQFIRTVLMRQTLDNLYLANSPRTLVQEAGPDSVNYDDLLNVRPGGIIRTRAGATVMPFAVPFVADKAFTMMDQLSTLKQDRTGVYRLTQGLDADVINQTASGVGRLMDAASQRIELIARLFAETGVTQLARGLLELICKYQDSAAMIKLRGQWVQMDPREWDTLYDVSVEVGLGTGNRDAQLTHLMSLLQIQTQAIQMQGGLAGPLVSLPNLYATVAEIVKNAGLKDPDRYFMDPAKTPPAPMAGPPPAGATAGPPHAPPPGAPPPAPPPGPPPAPAFDPNLALAQNRARLDQQESAVKLHVQQAEAQGRMQLARLQAQAQAALEQWKAQQQVALEREKLASQERVQRLKAGVPPDQAPDQAPNQTNEVTS